MFKFALRVLLSVLAAIGASVVWRAIPIGALHGSIHGFGVIVPYALLATIVAGVSSYKLQK